MLTYSINYARVPNALITCLALAITQSHYKHISIMKYFFELTICEDYIEAIVGTWCPSCDGVSDAAFVQHSHNKKAAPRIAGYPALLNHQLAEVSIVETLIITTLFMHANKALRCCPYAVAIISMYNTTA